MATYYSSPGSERDSQTMYSAESGNASYPVPSTLGNMLYPNNASSGPYTEFSGIIQHQQNFMELPGHPSSVSHDSSSKEATNMVTSLTEQRSFGPLKDMRNEMLMHLMDGAHSDGSNLIHNDAHNTTQLDFGMLNNHNSTNVPSAPGQGLSLSLNTNILAPSYPYWSVKPDLLAPHAYQGDENRIKNMQSEASQAIRNSKYLKAAQELLDEIVSVWKSVKRKADKGNVEAGKTDVKETEGGTNIEGVSSNPQESGANAAADLSTAEKQELQNKVAKLMAMLDEVTSSLESELRSQLHFLSSVVFKMLKDPIQSISFEAWAKYLVKTYGLPGQNSKDAVSACNKHFTTWALGKARKDRSKVDRKYKHYYHQMQLVVASFDMVAGSGAAKPYTAVALQTISRHFRCLKDAINDQISVIRKKLGEEDNGSGKEGRLTRLRYIDQQLRQQRAFQQYGMLQQNAWRPQRGLPENSVSILRAWLFEHFLHPYPKDSEKLMLARQTGLTRSQISNWFINARVRLWKPMIEDMYKEEIGEVELDSNSSSDTASRSKVVPSSDEKEDLKSPTSQACQNSQLGESKANISMINLSGTPASFHNEANPDDSFMNLMLKDQRPGETDGSFLHDAHHSDDSTRFMAYHLAELGRYGNNSVSLTLGLQHAENSLSIPSTQPAFAGVGHEDLYNATAPLNVAPTSSEYESTNQMDQQQRFEPSPLMHDFVA